MLFLASEAMKKSCPHIAEILQELTHSMRTVRRDEVPKDLRNKTFVTLVVMERKNGAQVRVLLPDQAREMGIAIPRWSRGAVIGVAPVLDFFRLDRPVRRIIKTRARTEMMAAVGILQERMDSVRAA